MATTQPTPDDSSIEDDSTVSVDMTGTTLTGAERRAVASIIEQHRDTYGENSGLTADAVAVRKLSTGFLWLRFPKGSVASTSTAQSAVGPKWSADGMLAYSNGGARLDISHENR